jgi:DNA ligase (NAD+)
MNDNPLYKELEKLKREIHIHNYHYHVLDAPIISDLEFDRLLVRLRQLEGEHPEWVTPDSPTQRAGAKAEEKFEKTPHPTPILSLANAFNKDDLLAWYERICKLEKGVGQASFVVEPKIDGLTVVLHYRDGIFMKGATRGDGEVGEDITQNLRTIRSLPLRIPVNPEGPKAPQYLVVRGEVFIKIKNFEQLNRRLQHAGERTYLNPRNTAAGSLRQLDASITASRPLVLLTYAIVALEGSIKPTTQCETLEYLRALGFPVTNVAEKCDGIISVIAVSERWKDLRKKLDFEVDGIVIKLDDLRLADNLGTAGKDPRGALALKFPALEVTTILKDIGVNVGRTGVLTPFAILEAVEVGGVIVKQATLHNFDFIAEKDIRVGDRVLIKRAGDVIPYVIGPVSVARSGEEVNFKPPENCPVCQQPVEHFPGEVAWYCVNATCPAQLLRNLEHFVSRPAMDIDGLGIKIVDLLIEGGLVKDVADLYTLRQGDLLELEGFAEKKERNVLNAIAASRSQPLNRLINALGIRGVGEVVASVLSKHYEDLGTLSHAALHELQTIDGVGPNIASAIVDWFARPNNKNILEKLKNCGVWPENAADLRIATEGMFKGQVFVITGTLPNFSREDVKMFIQNRSGKVTDSISKKTNYLVAGSNPGSKLEKAKELGVAVIDETALKKLAGE